MTPTDHAIRVLARHCLQEQGTTAHSAQRDALRALLLRTQNFDPLVFAHAPDQVLVVWLANEDSYAATDVFSPLRESAEDGA